MRPHRALVVLLGLAGMAAVIAAISRPPEPAPVGPGLPDAVDSLADQLRRCRDLGSAAPADEVCREVWRQARERFLAPSHRPAR